MNLLWRKITDFYQAISFASIGQETITGHMEETPHPFEVDVQTAAEQLKAGATLLDVREPNELDFCQVSGALTIPMGQIPHQLEALPEEGALYVLCHHGMRSGQVTAFLRQRGFDNAINVAGGIDAWSREVDPTIPRY